MQTQLLPMLKDHPFFCDLPDNLLETIAEKSKLVEFQAGDQIVTQDTYDPRLLLVQSGTIRAFKALESDSKPNSVFLRQLSAPSFIGLTGFLLERNRSATLIANSTGSFFEIPFETLRAVFTDHFNQPSWPLLKKILESLSDKIRDKNRRLAIITKTAESISPDNSDQVNVGVFDSRNYVERSFNEIDSKNLKFTYYNVRLNEKTVSLAAAHKIICCFVNDDLNFRVLQELKELGVEMIALRCAGYNQIDLKACDELGIRVARVPAYSPHAVAEHAVAMLLGINRKLHLAHQRILQANFTLDGLVGMDLYGKTVGVIGLGKIGICFAKIMKGFGTNVLYYDPFDQKEYEYGKPAELEEIFKQSDVISLHCPLTPDTKHILDKDAFEKMKPGTIVVNTSRGGLIDANDLIDALKSKKIAAAALDVYEEEQDYFFEDLSSEVMQDDLLARLISMNQVLVTSHQAFLTNEALGNIASTTKENIEEYLEKKAANSQEKLNNEVHV